MVRAYCGGLVLAFIEDCQSGERGASASLAALTLRYAAACAAKAVVMVCLGTMDLKPLERLGEACALDASFEEDTWLP